VGTTTSGHDHPVLGEGHSYSRLLVVDRGGVLPRWVRAHQLAQDGARRTLSAHRFALLLTAGTLDHHTFGEHHCNETLCVRVDPTHLHPGTQSANLRYAVSLGRHRGCLPTDIDPRGRHGRAHAIRAALTGGYDPLRLAAARAGGYDLLSPTLPLFDLSTR